MLELRDYQRDCLSAIEKARLGGYRRQLIAMPTGTGKTIVFAHLVRQTGAKSIVFAHTLELVYQTTEKLRMVIPDTPIGTLTGERKDNLDARIIVSTVQTACYPLILPELAKRDYRLVVADEAHHFAADGCKRIMEALDPELLVGFTATPYRQDGRGLKGIFDVISFQRSTATMVRAGWLAPPRGYKIAKEIDLRGVAMGVSDYQIEQLDAYMNTPEMNRAVIDSSIEKMGDRPTIVFGVSCDHARNLADELNRRGKAAEYIAGHMNTKEREQILERYREGKTQILTNCMLLTEGWDAPWTSCVLMAAPTRSRGRFSQCVGRGLRLWPGKTDCLVIDCNEKSHDICDVALLMGDRKDAKKNSEKLDISVLDGDEEKIADGKSELSKIPRKLHPNLKTVLQEFQVLKGRFVWKKDEFGRDYIEGLGVKVLLRKRPDGLYDVDIVRDNGTGEIEAKALSYEYAFGSAEDWCRSHKKYFILSDTEAEWRSAPISENQIAALRKFGYTAGVEELSKGDAQVLMSHLIANKQWTDRPAWLQRKIDEGRK